MRKTGTGMEGVILNLCDTIRNNYGCQLAATGEGVGADVCDTIRNNYGRQIDAIGEGTFGDVCNREPLNGGWDYQFSGGRFVATRNSDEFGPDFIGQTVQCCGTGLRCCQSQADSQKAYHKTKCEQLFHL